MRGAGLLLALLLLAPALAGCLAPDGPGQGVVVTSQGLLDALQRLGVTDELAGFPDWAVQDEPLEAAALGRPFTVPAEAVLALSPRLLLDQPHPLVSGPDRDALRQRAAEAGIQVEVVPTEPSLATAHATLQAVARATGTDPAPAWEAMLAGLNDTRDQVEGLDRPNVLVLFPAGLTAGAGTDIDLLLDMAGLDNVATEAGLTGYRQITAEAVATTGVDLVVATATMREDPAGIAAMPMLEGTEVEDRPDRVLVIDPARTMRVGPYMDEGVAMLTQWAHPELPGERIGAWLSPTKLAACEETTLHTSGNASHATLAGDTIQPGPFRVPDLPPGHYRVRVHGPAVDAGAAYIDLLLTVEGTECDT